MKLEDWNHAHKIKEQIENDYEVFVHILGKGCLITTNCPILLEANNWNDCLAMIEIQPDEVEKITGLEWCSKTFDLFFKNMKNLKISAKELKQ